MATGFADQSWPVGWNFLCHLGRGLSSSICASPDPVSSALAPLPSSPEDTDMLGPLPPGTISSAPKEVGGDFGILLSER